jgi:prepilin-type processing-associated H-X9-DG protein
MSLSIAILAGGLATRLRPLTEQIPKSLIDVAGRSFALHQVELLRRHDIINIVFLVGHLGEMIRDTLGDGASCGVRLRYVFDRSPALGTGGAVRGALPDLEDPFFVLYGDSYLECDFGAIERAFLSSGKSGLMTVCRNDDRWDRSNVLFTDGHIVRYEKAASAPDMRHIDYGLGVFRKTAFSGYAPDEAFDLAGVYRGLLARDDLAAFEVPGRFYEIGSPAGLAETRAYLAHKGAPAV